MKHKEFRALKALAELGGRGTSQQIEDQTGITKQTVAGIMRNNYPIVTCTKEGGIAHLSVWQLADPMFWLEASWRTACRTRYGNHK